MANSVSAGPSMDVKQADYNALIPVQVVLDTTGAQEVKALVTDCQLAVHGYELLNGETGVSDITFESYNGTTGSDIGRDRASAGGMFRKDLKRYPYFVTDKGCALRINCANASPNVKGVIWVSHAIKDGSGGGFYKRIGND